MPKENAVAAIYDTHRETEMALRTLQRSGFDMYNVSVVGKAYRSGGRATDTVCDRLPSTLLAVPEIGPVFLAGPIVCWILSAFDRATGLGLDAIGAGLRSIGIPGDWVLRYEAALRTAKYLLIAHGSREEVTRVSGVLSSLPVATVTVHVGDPGIEVEDAEGSTAV